MATERAIEKLSRAEVVPVETAQEVDGRINALIREELNAETVRSRRCAELGRLLLRVQNEELFTDLGFENFTDWIKGKKESFGIDYPWLFAYKTSAERLLPYLKDETFDAIGISKARELSKLVRATQSRPDLDIIEMAKRPEMTVKALREVVAERINAPEPEAGRWLDLGGFRVTAEEKKVLKRAYEIAKRVKEIPQDWPEWKQRKEAVMAMAEEFLGTYEAEFTDKVEGRISKKVA